MSNDALRKRCSDVADACERSRLRTTVLPEAGHVRVWDEAAEWASETITVHVQTAGAGWYCEGSWPGTLIRPDMSVSEIARLAVLVCSPSTGRRSGHGE